MRSIREFVRDVALALPITALCVVTGCRSPSVPESPEPAARFTCSDSCSWPGATELPVPVGRFSWRIEPATGGAPMNGTLRTALSAGKFRWTWEFAVPPPTEAGGRLIPANPQCWHGIELVPGDADSSLPLPLMRITSGSDSYPDLLSLLQDLSEPWFEYKVTHWPELPVPVRVGSAVGGIVDLSSCLRQAIAVWNADPDRPWFRIDEEAAWGVRLVHFQDLRLSPPLAARITRLDDEHRPLRISILVGNNYDDLHEPKYVVRGFVHELAHALFLWGHSLDRDHCLWGAAPPIVDRPHEDERKAALLWHGLPEGTDLSKYFSVSEPEARTGPSRPADRPAVPPPPACRPR